MIFVFFLWTTIGFSQEEETILWQESVVLHWSDFKEIPPKSDRIAAITASGISYQFSAIENRSGAVTIDFEVNTFFYPNKSWYKPKICDRDILRHEQLHFDISELFARKMRKRLSKKHFTKRVKSEVNTIYKSILKELNDFQNLYDSETNFSRNKEKQLLWNRKIQEALKEVL